MPLTRSLLALLGLTALAPLARADFTGNYALTPPAGQTFTSGATAGAWSFSASGSGTNNEVFDTTNAPASLVLFALGVDFDGSGSSGLTITSLEAGTISFDYDLSISTGGSLTLSTASFTYALNSNTTTLSTSGTSTVYWNVEPGDTISFNTSAHGGQDLMYIPPPANFFVSVPTAGSASVTLSNFAFTATVPEPGTYAVMFALGSLGLVALKKKCLKTA